MKKIIQLLMLLSITGFLAACSSMNSGFDCPNKAGVMCKSVDQINGMVDTGQIQGRSQELTKVGQSNQEFQPYPVTAAYSPGAPLRYGETVQRIWIAPYEDTENNYHQDNLMYAIVKDGHWIGTPPKSEA
jgi:conjugal transfer pilus assembly protein TraV